LGVYWKGGKVLAVLGPVVGGVECALNTLNFGLTPKRGKSRFERGYGRLVEGGVAEMECGDGRTGGGIVGKGGLALLNVLVN